MKKLLGKYGLTVRDLMQCIGGSVVACVLVFMIMIGMLTASAGCNDTTVQEPEKHYLVGDIGDVMIVDHVVNHPKVVKRIADIGLEDGYLSKTTDDYDTPIRIGLGAGETLHQIELEKERRARQAAADYEKAQRAARTVAARIVEDKWTNYNTHLV